MDSRFKPQAEKMSDAYVRGMEKCCVAPFIAQCLEDRSWIAFGRHNFTAGALCCKCNLLGQVDLYYINTRIFATIGMFLQARLIR